MNSPSDDRSSGRCSTFQQHWFLRTVNSHGGSGDTNDANIVTALPSLDERSKQFARKDRLDAD